LRAAPARHGLDLLHLIAHGLIEDGVPELEEEARALREERDRLRAELETERSKGFWARLFGG